jgi:Restriction endonuclease BglII
MQIAGVYSFKNGKEILEDQYAPLLDEVFRIVGAINTVEHEANTIRRKYDPASIYKTFKKHFNGLHWKTLRVPCENNSAQEYLKGNGEQPTNKAGYRTLDFVKEKLGLNVEIGKFLPITSTCAKMTIFHNLGHIDCGIEIVPVKAFANEMSTGVSYFEQFIWDLENRGVSDIDIPVMIIGIDA